MLALSLQKKTGIAAWPFCVGDGAVLERGVRNEPFSLDRDVRRSNFLTIDAFRLLGLLLFGLPPLMSLN